MDDIDEFTYQQGCDSYYNGLCATNNPYEVGSEDYRDWHQGYTDAYFDRVGSKYDDLT